MWGASEKTSVHGCWRTIVPFYVRFITMYLVFECWNAHGKWIRVSGRLNESEGTGKNIYMTEMTMMGIKITHNFFLSLALFNFGSVDYLNCHTYAHARNLVGVGKSHFARFLKRMNVNEWQIFWNILHIQWFYPLSVCKLKLKFEKQTMRKNGFSLLPFFFFVPKKRWRSAKNWRGSEKGKNKSVREWRSSIWNKKVIKGMNKAP